MVQLREFFEDMGKTLVPLLDIRVTKVCLTNGSPQHHKFISRGNSGARDSAGGLVMGKPNPFTFGRVKVEAKGGTIFG
jgi:hypothetical protein